MWVRPIQSTNSYSPLFSFSEHTVLSITKIICIMSLSSGKTNSKRKWFSFFLSGIFIHRWRLSYMMDSIQVSFSYNQIYNHLFGWINLFGTEKEAKLLKFLFILSLYTWIEKSHFFFTENENFLNSEKSDSF